MSELSVKINAKVVNAHSVLIYLTPSPRPLRLQVSTSSDHPQNSMK